MSWADPVIATALAVLAERTATTARIFVAAPSGWNSQDVWLTRVHPSRALTVHRSLRGASTLPRLSTSLPQGKALC